MDKRLNKEISKDINVSNEGKKRISKEFQVKIKNKDGNYKGREGMTMKLAGNARKKIEKEQKRENIGLLRIAPRNLG